MKKELKKIAFVVFLPLFIPTMFVLGFMIVVAIGIPEILKAIGGIIKEELNS